MKIVSRTSFVSFFNFGSIRKFSSSLLILVVYDMSYFFSMRRVLLFLEKNKQTVSSTLTIGVDTFTILGGEFSTGFNVTYYISSWTLVPPQSVPAILPLFNTRHIPTYSTTIIRVRHNINNVSHSGTTNLLEVGL